ncbi:MAG: response regulator [Microcoleaceae cyanobacterium]
MQVEQQQRIMGYFIEEAKDHLDTIEQGLLNLQATIEDPDLLYEVYRAAHSVKGGAAMLGLNSIQATAHRLEDSFKVLEKIQNKSKVLVDQELESQFLEISDTLKALVDGLSSPYGLTEDVAQSLLRDVEPAFKTLNLHLNQLAQQSGLVLPELSLSTGQTSQVVSPQETVVEAPRSSTIDPQAQFFQHQVPEQLREMLQLFKRPENSKSRTALCSICQDLSRKGTSLDLPEWTNCVEHIEQAIANPVNNYQALAPVVIRSLKQAQNLALNNQAHEIEVSPEIQDLVHAPAVGQPTMAPRSTESTPSTDLTLSAILGNLPSSEPTVAETAGKFAPKGPEIAPVELKSLADLFVGVELTDEGCEKEAVRSPEMDAAETETESHQNFLDLFDDSEDTVATRRVSSEISAPVQEQSALSSGDEDFSDFDDLLNIGSTIDSDRSPSVDELLAEPSIQSTPEPIAPDFQDVFGLEDDPMSAFPASAPSADPATPPQSSQPALDNSGHDEDWFEQLVSGNVESALDATGIAHQPSDSEMAGGELFDELFGSLPESELSEGTSQKPSPSTHPTMADSSGFEDLDSLLEDTEAVVAQSDESFSDLDSLLQANESTSDSDEEHLDDADFADLEQLLGDEVQQTSALASGRTRAPAKGARMYEPIAKVPVKQLDDLSNLMGELVVNRNSLEQDQERMRQFLDNLLDQVSLLSDVGQRMQDFYERSLLEISLLSNRKQPIWNVSKGSSGLPHEMGFDSTELDRFTPFHTLSQEIIELVVRVRESAADIGFLVEEADQVTRQLRQISTQLEEGLTKARMESFAQEADRLKRPVRDISIKCGKQAELYVEGRDTLIDKMLLGKLHDPLVHIVNNAITHGIETPEVRVAAGKPPTGKITIKVFHQGNQTVLAISDDGAGINTKVVKQKAVKKGLITPEQARAASDIDAYELLFHPGFSLRDKADEYAGRGVGMDVVRTSLTEVRGSITTDSTVGRGTTFTIRLPLNMSISRALCCISDRARIAFPMDGVEDMIDVPRDQVQTGENGETTLEWRGTRLPFRHLRDLLVYNRHLGRGNVYGANIDEDMISVVVLRSSGSFLAVQVDQVLIEQEIVIKQLETPVPKPVGIAGATVLGDGQIVAIADVLELIDLATGRIRRDGAGKIWQSEPPLLQEVSQQQSESTVLIVDDSITVRSLLSITFEKAGYLVEEARDGKEAWEKLKSGLPCDLVFCDIEMPRMDGLELLSRMQKDPILSNLPIAMLTSRGADRHRQMAYQLGARGYFTKPYLEEQLLEAAQRMLKGEIIGKVNVQPAATV